MWPARSDASVVPFYSAIFFKSLSSDNIDCHIVINKINCISTKCDGIGEKISCQPMPTTIVVYKVYLLGCSFSKQSRHRGDLTYRW